LGIASINAFTQPQSLTPTARSSSILASTATATSDTEIQDAKELLCRAAETKLENPDRVFISGEWRLIFTTGTKERQKKSGGRVNYFPLKAIQKFDATVEPKVIENGIYAWDLPLLRFSGDFDFDARRRKLEFDFDLIEILGLIKIKLGRKDVAKIGASTGLGSANNEKLADSGRRAFFDWISADESIATARGGGGGLALWKRVD